MKLSIKSYRGPYHVNFGSLPLPRPNEVMIIDKRVAELYPGIRRSTNVYIDAHENNKVIETSMQILDELPETVESFCVVGGGITQDIGSFAAGVYKRGTPWNFIPTTLLAMADSCVGSKSSLNYNGYKNQIGLFYPPKDIYIDTNFLKTLKHEDFVSGKCEILKLLSIGNVPWGTANVVDQDLIHKALTIKKHFIETDEFDKGDRRILNYGHTFGHAVEKLSDYKVPHGIAVLVGMFIIDTYYNAPIERYEPYWDLIINAWQLFDSRPSAVYNVIKTDKKKNGNMISLIRRDNTIVTMPLTKKLVKDIMTTSSWILKARCLPK